jgi:hypothetical protein
VYNYEDHFQGHAVLGFLLASLGFRLLPPWLGKGPRGPCADAVAPRWEWGEQHGLVQRQGTCLAMRSYPLSRWERDLKAPPGHAQRGGLMRHEAQHWCSPPPSPSPRLRGREKTDRHGSENCMTLTLSTST